MALPTPTRLLSNFPMALARQFDEPLLVEISILEVDGLLALVARRSQRRWNLWDCRGGRL